MAMSDQRLNWMVGRSHPTEARLRVLRHFDDIPKES